MGREEDLGESSKVSSSEGVKRPKLVAIPQLPATYKHPEKVIHLVAEFIIISEGDWIFASFISTPDLCPSSGISISLAAVLAVVISRGVHHCCDVGTDVLEEWRRYSDISAAWSGRSMWNPSSTPTA